MMVLSTAVANETRQMPIVIVVATNVVGYWESSSFTSSLGTKADLRGFCVVPAFDPWVVSADHVAGGIASVLDSAAKATSVVCSAECVRVDRKAARSCVDWL